MTLFVRLSGLHAALLAVTTGLLAVATSQAQGQQSASGGTLVALIDLDYVFTTHSAFKEQLDRLKEDAKKLEADRKAIVARLEGLKKELSALKPGSPEYKSQEQKLAQELADAQVQSELRMKDLTDQQARLHFDEYNLILKEVEAVARKNGIGLVLRFDREAIDSADRNSVLRGVNRMVVFQQDLDISDLVLEGLQARPARVSGRPVTGPRNTKKQN